MPYTVTPSALPEVLILEPKVFGDDRGFFFESFNQRDFQHFDGILKHHMRSNACILLSCDPATVMERRPDIAYDKSYLQKVRIYALLRRMYGIDEVATDKATPGAFVERTIFLCA